MSSSAILTQSERNLVTFQGYAGDVEATLDTLVYTPPRNMSHWANIGTPLWPLISYN